MTYGELRERMTDEEFLMWRAYDAHVEPIGSHSRVGRQVALLGWAYGETHRDRKSHPSPWRLDDWDLYRRLEPEPQPEDPAEERRRYLSFFASRNLLVRASDVTAASGTSE